VELSSKLGDKLSGDLSEAEAAAMLTQRIQQGDSSAEQQMVLRYEKQILLALTNKTRDRYIAEDMLQETWAVVLPKIRGGEVKDPTKLFWFILSVGKNRCLMKFRAKSSSEQQLSDEAQGQLQTGDLSPEQLLENKRLRQTIKDVLSSLPQQRDRELLMKFYLSKANKDELCDEYGLTKSHFDRVIYRARQRFISSWSQNEQ